MAYSKVQGKAGNHTVSNVTDVTFDNSCISGNLVTVKASIADSADTITATCTVGGVSAPLVSGSRVHNANISSGWTAMMFSLVLSSGGAHKVEVTWSSASSNERMTITEYSGNAASSVVDQVNTGTGSSSSPSSGNVTPTEDNELIEGYCITESGSISPGTGFTGLETVDGFDEPEYLVQGSAATIDADWTAGNNDWLAIVTTFKALNTPPPQLPYLGLMEPDLNLPASMEPDLG